MITDLDRIQPVDLGAMDTRAALRTRKDRKYVIPVCELEHILLGLELDRVHVLERGRRRVFGYESIYLDTGDLRSFRDAARRRRRRYKVRTRRYLDRGDTFLEAKVRTGRGLNTKHRLPVAEADHGRLTRAGIGFLDGIEGVQVDPRELGPSLVTRYERATLVAVDSATRMTVDTALTWALPGGASLHVPDIAIVETKSEGRPTDFDRLLWQAGHRPTKVSKYGTGIAALDHSLSANKWHRVLRDHFDRNGSPGSSACAALQPALFMA